MMKIRMSDERGRTDLGWLDSRHSFSFAGYYAPAHMHFRQLRVINDDRVAPGTGFATHSHENMEIISFVVEGAIEHRDSMGNVHTLRRGEAQRMSAGTGIRHSEYNPSDSEPLRFLQIWILPAEKGLQPGYEKMNYEDRLQADAPCLLVSPDGRADSLRIHQDVALYLLQLTPGSRLELPLQDRRHAWIQVVDGVLEVNGRVLRAGDGLAVSQEPRLRFRGIDASELLIFDLA